MFMYKDAKVIFQMGRVVMMVSVMVMVVAGAESTITSRKFKKFENIRAEGTVLISQEVSFLLYSYYLFNDILIILISYW